MLKQFIAGAFCAMIAATAGAQTPATGHNCPNCKDGKTCVDKGTAAHTCGQPAKVYFTKDISPEGLLKAFHALGVKPEGRVAVKISTGESKESNQLSPQLIAPLVNEVKGTIVECNTAYPGNRNTTEKHWKTIKEHGYLDIANVDIMDAEGNMNIPVRDTTWIKYDIVGKHIANYDFLINLAHFKGHQMGGFGGVLKNQSIGVASADGKSYIHTAGHHKTVEEGPWENPHGQDAFIESMAAAAQAVHDFFKGKAVYINVMNNMSIDCDCNGHPAKPLLKDMGIMISLDPVALDKAATDMVFSHESAPGDDSQPLINRIKQMHGLHIIGHAAKIGLGTTDYELINID